MIAAHPFRGFLLFGMGGLQSDPVKASERTMFRLVDGIEVGNCKVTDNENTLARDVAAHLGLPGVAGSDAHRIDELGKHVTVFEKAIQTEEQLIEEIRAGRFSTTSLR